jgi:hypothetical protein
MIEAHTIPLLALPSLPFVERRRLPRCAAIYFVLNAEGTVLYVGQSINLALRWAAHHRMTKLVEHHAMRIAWLLMDDVSILDAVESACIAYFDPLCNGRRDVPHRAQRLQKGEPYKKILIRIPPDILAALEAASHGEDRSINGQLVHVLRQWADQQETTSEPPKAAKPRAGRPAKA